MTVKFISLVNLGDDDPTGEGAEVQGVVEARPPSQQSVQGGVDLLYSKKNNHKY